jgi:putative transposase
MTAVQKIAPQVGIKSACAALQIARATHYRRLQPKTAKSPLISPRAISVPERRAILDTLNSQEFVDRAPQAVYATLLDQGIYLCSPSSMYRFLADAKMVRERRDQVRRHNYARPELMATQSNQLWSWDITKLRGNRPYLYYYLYTMLDVFSRFVVGWMIAETERADMAQILIQHCCDRQNILPTQLTIHADRGSPMIAKPVAALLDQLGVAKSHSRPHVSNDNPFIEAHFKTFKYHHRMDKKFGCVEHARQSARLFYDWYNYEHKHSGIAYLTPANVHEGVAQKILDLRHQVRLQALQRHPERFVRGKITPVQAPSAVWINPPASAPHGSLLSDPSQQSEVMGPLDLENRLTGGGLMH